MNNRFYKILGEDGSCLIAEKYDEELETWARVKNIWPLNGSPTEPIEGKLIPCKNGLHLCTITDLGWWIQETRHRCDSYVLWEAEPIGSDVLYCGIDYEYSDVISKAPLNPYEYWATKVVCRQARLTGIIGTIDTDWEVNQWTKFRKLTNYLTEDESRITYGPYLLHQLGISYVN